MLVDILVIYTIMKLVTVSLERLEKRSRKLLTRKEEISTRQIKDSI